MLRVEQDDWAAPVRQSWVARLSETIERAPGPVVVVAHSLGCITTTHLPPEITQRIQGALLVAPADPERRGVLADFAPVPYQRLPYRSILVASNNDPYCPVRTAGAYARAWAANSCGSTTRDTSTWIRAMGHGRWGWRCCSRWGRRCRWGCGRWKWSTDTSSQSQT